MKLTRATASDLVAVGEAALFGVVEMTLWRMHKAKKLVPSVHSLSGDRLCERSAVLKLRVDIERGRTA